MRKLAINMKKNAKSSSTIRTKYKEEGEGMKFVSVLKFDDPNREDIVSIEFDTEEEAKDAGETGQAFYLADGYRIETVSNS